MTTTGAGASAAAVTPGQYLHVTEQDAMTLAVALNLLREMVAGGEPPVIITENPTLAMCVRVAEQHVVSADRQELIQLAQKVRAILAATMGLKPDAGD